ncbi:MAG TPA: hypothetical protein VFV00_17120 [Acidimicrobiales bacterium]|nr:hypothetical protein [Acidimicrobiales bacterium]
MTGSVTVITDDVASVEGEVVGTMVRIAPNILPAAIGWELKPEGLCRDDVCVPVRNRDRLFAGDDLDLSAVAEALGRRIVIDTDERVAALALPSEERRRALTDHVAPPFTLPDLDGTLHSLEEWRGRKKLLIAFSSW